MAFLLSPAVSVKEIDLTLVIPGVATSIGATVGKFEWGPVMDVNLVDSEKNLASWYGLPNNTNYKDWYTTANFLSYSNAIELVRIVGDSALNSAAFIDTTKIDTATDIIEVDAAKITSTYKVDNGDDYDLQISTIESDADVAILAKYPGAYGDKIQVSMMDAAHADAAGDGSYTNWIAWEFSDEFDYKPEGTDLFVIVEYDSVIVERFYANRDPSSVSETGGTNYFEEMINRTSSYIWVVAENLSRQDDGTSVSNAYTGTLTTGFNLTPINFTATLSGGDADDAGIVDGDYTAGWDLFNDDQSYDINLCMAGGASHVVGKYITEIICEGRKDCISFLSPLETTIVNVARATLIQDLIDEREDAAFNINSSYAVMDGNYKYQYDRYNDKYRWLPLNGDIAGLCARTDNDRDPWWSPGGLNRGQIKNVTKLAFNPSRAERDKLYPKSINPVVSFKGEGTVLWGDKTLQTKPSAFDRINVRRLFIVLEKAIATASKYQLFEFNDAITRNNFVNMVEPFLRDVKGRRGIYDYLVVCDETNNTGEVIDRNELVADIYIKPARAINYIYLNFVAVKTGVAFEEVLLTNDNV